MLNEVWASAYILSSLAGDRNLLGINRYRIGQELSRVKYKN